MIDFNRVETAIGQLQTLLNGLGYNFNIPINATRQFDEIFFVEELPEYLAKVETLRAGFCPKPDTPLTPDNFKPYTKANDIEKILADVYELIQIVPISYIESGEVESGEV